MVIIVVFSWIALLFVLVATGVLKGWTTWMKISPLIVYLAAMLAFFIPMGSGAPGGPLVALAYSVQIAPSVTGVVVDVPIKAGTLVKKGDVLVKLDPTPFSSKVDQMKAQLALAQARLEQKEKLADAGTGRRTELEQAETEARILVAQLQAAEWELEHVTIRAPSDGYVPNQGIQSGARVNAGVAILPFIDSSRLAIVMEVPQNGYRYIRVGQIAEMVLDMYPGQVIPGKVKFVVPSNAAGQITPSGLALSVKTDSQPFLVELEFDTPLQIPPGATGVAGVYTDRLRMTHPVRKVMLRGRAWLNYL